MGTSSDFDSWACPEGEAIPGFNQKSEEELISAALELMQTYGDDAEIVAVERALNAVALADQVEETFWVKVSTIIRTTVPTFNISRLN